MHTNRMSVIIHEEYLNKPRDLALFEKTLKQRLRRQRGSRNLLFDEAYANRKKVWNRWTGAQMNLTRKALRNMQSNQKWVRNNMSIKNNENNNNYNENVTSANLNSPEWRIGVGNLGYEPVPKLLKPNRTLRRNRFSQ